MNINADKKAVEANFTRASTTYDNYARMQKQAAGLLIEQVTAAFFSLPDGAILEVGCGTGQMSCHVAQIAGSRKLLFSDIAPGMVEICQNKLCKLEKSSAELHFKVLDAEYLFERDAYAAVISGLTVQWFSDFSGTLKRIYNALLPGGEFIFSCLVRGSFEQWFAACRKIDVPCTANDLPQPQRIHQDVEAVFDAFVTETHTIEVEYPGAEYFLRSLKLTGTNVQAGGHRLTVSQMRQLIRSWDLSLQGAPLRVGYVIEIVRAKKKLI